MTRRQQSPRLEVKEDVGKNLVGELVGMAFGRRKELVFFLQGGEGREKRQSFSLLSPSLPGTLSDPVKVFN